MVTFAINAEAWKRPDVIKNMMTLMVFADLSIVLALLLEWRTWQWIFLAINLMFTLLLLTSYKKMTEMAIEKKTEKNNNGGDDLAARTEVDEDRR